MTDALPTVLLDLDGTLTDSAALITEHLAAAIAGAGGPVFTPAQLLPLVGPPFEYALPELGLTDEQVAATVTAYRSSYGAVAATNTPLYPGITDLLDRLSGFRLALATAKPERLAAEIVDGLGLTRHFALVGGSDPVAGRVGKGPVVGSVLERLGLDPARDPVVMVGDRHHDVEGAAEHGVPTIGVSWGYATSPEELADAALVVADVDALAEALLSWRASGSVRFRKATMLP
ncbi:HAD-IA family hydrolase [Pseudonocardia humida]|uniref:HAD-IA family hydrolase n=1 Tax=Pseudonocardia humida TaxID=2800819 RepID=A0ABT1A324_9PSEU|nr:HAD-IA family hydrolase [Pseudonocardia humida]MCO1657390.1 HAD-IA family hydrolase [Pseudonocardia humida]